VRHRHARRPAGEAERPVEVLSPARERLDPGRPDPVEGRADLAHAPAPHAAARRYPAVRRTDEGPMVGAYFRRPSKLRVKLGGGSPSWRPAMRPRGLKQMYLTAGS